jgi:hypothetical protein
MSVPWRQLWQLWPTTVFDDFDEVVNLRQGSIGTQHSSIIEVMGRGQLRVMLEQWKGGVDVRTKLFLDLHLKDLEGVDKVLPKMEQHTMMEAQDDIKHGAVGLIAIFQHDQCACHLRGGGHNFPQPSVNTNASYQEVLLRKKLIRSKIYFYAHSS